MTQSAEAVGGGLSEATHRRGPGFARLEFAPVQAPSLPLPPGPLIGWYKREAALSPAVVAGKGRRRSCVGWLGACGDASSLVGPVTPGPSVRLDRDDCRAGAHAVAVERPVQVVHLVQDQAGESVFVPDEAAGSVEVGVGDDRVQGPGDQATDVEVTQAPLVLLVRLGGGLGDVRVEEHDRFGLRVRGRTTAAARSMPIWQAAIPMPLPNVCS